MRLQQQSAGDALSGEICAHDAERTLEDQQPYPSFTTAINPCHQKAPAEAGAMHSSIRSLTPAITHWAWWGELFRQDGCLRQQQ